MLSHIRNIRSRSSLSHSIIRDIDKSLSKKSAKTESNNTKVKDSTGAKKVANPIKVIKNKTSFNNNQLVKCDSIVVEMKNIVRKKIDTDTLDDQIIEDTKVKSSVKELLGMRKNNSDKEQIKTFLSIMPAFKKSKREVSYYQQDISNTLKS
jgi:hypothetical protein